MGDTVSNRSAHPRVQLAGGILKALFTTSPRQPTDVVLTEDGSVEMKPAPVENEGAETVNSETADS